MYTYPLETHEFTCARTRAHACAINHSYDRVSEKQNCDRIFEYRLTFMRHLNSSNTGNGSAPRFPVVASPPLSAAIKDSKTERFAHAKTTNEPYVHVINYTCGFKCTWYETVACGSNDPASR